MSVQRKFTNRLLVTLWIDKMWRSGEFVCEFLLDFHLLRWEIVWRKAPRIWRDFGSALPFQTSLTQTKPVLPLSNEHGSQVKDQGRRRCCHNKHKNFPIGLHVIYLYFPDRPRTFCSCTTHSCVILGYLPYSLIRCHTPNQYVIIKFLLQSSPSATSRTSSSFTASIPGTASLSSTIFALLFHQQHLAYFLSLFCVLLSRKPVAEERSGENWSLVEREAQPSQLIISNRRWWGSSYLRGPYTSLKIVLKHRKTSDVIFKK